MPWNELSAGGAVLTIAAWAYLLLGRGNFWRIKNATASPGTIGAQPSPVAVVVPARNEARVIGRCLESLLQQSYGGTIHIFVVDDGSSDGTGGVANQVASLAAQAAGDNRRITVIAGEPLAAGWTGKLWAAQQGVQRASTVNPQLLWFTDADVAHGPQTLSRLAGIAQAGGYDLVSFMVRLRRRSLAEKLLIPAFVFFFFKLYPPGWVSDIRKNTAGAAGGCMLIRPQALARAGGLEAIRTEIIDDCALARAVKRSGGKTWLGLAPESESMRSYESFAEIGKMISRTAFSQLHHSGVLLLLALLGMMVSYVLPVGLLLVGNMPAKVCGAIALVIMMFCYGPMVRWYKLSPSWTLTLPLAAVFYMAATLASAVGFWRGRGGEWKGRIQDPGS